MTHAILRIAQPTPVVVSTHTTLEEAVEAIQPLYRRGWMRAYVVELPDGRRLGRSECERLYREHKRGPA